MMDDPYSRGRLRRSLTHFAVGKFATAIIGVLVLLMLVRYLPRDDYGRYVTLAATLELVQLISSFGLLVAAYRYIPELHSVERFHALGVFTWRLVRWRMITLLAGALLLVLIVALVERFGLVWLPFTTAVAFAAVIVLEGAARFIDVVFDSLLLQGFAQISTLVRNGLRLVFLGVALTAPAADVVEGFWTPLLIWIAAEASASAVGLALALSLLKRYLNKINLQSSANPELSLPDFDRVRDFVLPSYLAQVIGLAQGPDIAKILMAKLGGAIQVGAFGFAAALNGMAQRYLPVFLLIGMIRPMFVAAHQRGGDPRDLGRLASMVFKLNLMMLIPLGIWIGMMAPELASLLSGGKFPDAGWYLRVLIFLLVAQTLHAVLGLVLMVVEDGRSNIRACLYGLCVFGVAVTLAINWGPGYLVAGLLGAELAWCTVAWRALRRRGYEFSDEFVGYVKMILASIPSALAVYTLDLKLTGPMWLIVLAAGVAACAVFAIAAAILKPFTQQERGRINSVLPRPYFIW